MVLFPVNQLPLRARAPVVKILQLASRMATTIGTLQEFRHTEEDITAYLECVELYLKANDIVESKQVAVFLTVAGGKVYALLRDLLAPGKPNTKTFKELAQTLKNHYKP